MKVKREIDKEDEGKRVKYFSIIIVFIFLVLIGTLYYLQIINGDSYRDRAVRNSLRTNVVKATRGKIYDVKGHILADNATGYKIIHKFTKSISESEKKLLLSMQYDKSKALQNESEKKQKKLNEIYDDISYIAKISGNSFDEILEIFYKTVPTGFDKEITVVEDFDAELAQKEVEKLPNERIDIVEYNKRYYPENNIASGVIGNVKLISSQEYENLKDLGYTRDDQIGKKGIEKNYDSILKGSDGQEFVEVDVKGNVIKKIDEVSTKSGKNIYLSIDYDLQKHMTENFAGKAGSFIAIDVKTGKIITMVSSPEINLNILSSRISKELWNSLLNSKERPLVNKSIAGLYPSGSTFKVVSGAAILESGISPLETVYSTGVFTLGKVRFRDSHTSGHGTTNFYKSIEESVNTYYYTLLRRVPFDLFVKIASEFGIGEKTGIDIPGEQDGVLPTPEWKKKRFNKKIDQIWLPGDLVNLSIGQGYILVTPLQMLMVYQAIANDGIMLYPTLVDRFIDSYGNTETNERKIKKELKVSKQTIAELKKALELPVSGNNGTAHVLRIPGVKVSAKTGTAQNSSGNNHSWIAGYFPSDNPKIAFVSLVEQGGYGGVAAGQQAREFIEYYYNLKKGE
ncbi:penicillin-binding protein 2 [Caviibacter abscessus]|uniref:penicillin-binding protein 2 n=1 Tax=Caviibacter abscessus TaxID=1766719 RepID=UPI00082B62F7|nr:penicillin-binding protein 2 [Caviibacter abscessus]